MNKKEAAALVAMLVNAYPMAKFTEENAQVYEQNLIALDASDVQAAMTELVATSQFLPSIAAIRAEVTRARRERATRRFEREIDPKRLLGPGGIGNLPHPSEWAASLARMLATGERHQRMAAVWFSELGKATQPDPAQKFIELATAGASGADVRERLRRDVLPVSEQPEERYP